MNGSYNDSRAKQFLVVADSDARDKQQKLQFGRLRLNFKKKKILSRRLVLAVVPVCAGNWTRHNQSFFPTSISMLPRNVLRSVCQVSHLEKNQHTDMMTQVD